MSLEDYLRQVNHGAAAGPARNLPEALGQATFRQTADRTRGSDPVVGPHVPHAVTQPPHWMMHHAFKRGIFLLVGGMAAKLVLFLSFGYRPPTAIAFLDGVVSLVSLAGIPLILFGVLNFIVRMRRRVR